MWRINLAFVVAACFIVACESASVAETAVDPRSPRLGNTVRYYRTSWAHLVSGVELEEIENSAQGAQSLNLTATDNVVIVVHGRESGVYSPFGDSLRYSLGSADPDLVIIMVDWSFLSHNPYPQAVALASFIAADLRGFVALMGANNLELQRLHYIGFDLGAHIVGITSRSANARGIKITALDPAGENWGAFSLRLRHTDATFVEVIHTDGVGNMTFGTSEALGTLDIYPNGGTEQPGCAASDNACHHNRAWQLFAATVDTGGHLMALRCDSITQVNNNRCIGTPSALLGTLQRVKLQDSNNDNSSRGGLLLIQKHNNVAGTINVAMDYDPLSVVS